MIHNSKGGGNGHRQGVMRTQRGDNYKEDRYRQGMMRTQRGDNCQEDKVTSICTTIVKDLAGER